MDIELKRDLLCAFHEWDADHDGGIDEAELFEVLDSIGIPAADIPKLFTAADANRDGKVDYEEFIRWVCGEEGEKAPDALVEMGKSIRASKGAPIGFTTLQADGHPDVVLKMATGAIIKIPNGQLVDVLKEAGPADYEIEWRAHRGMVKKTNLFSVMPTKVVAANPNKKYKEVFLWRERAKVRIHNGTSLSVVKADINCHGFFYIVIHDGTEFSVRKTNVQISTPAAAAPAAPAAAPAAAGAAAAAEEIPVYDFRGHLRKISAAAHESSFESTPAEESLTEIFCRLVRSGAVRLIRYEWLQALADAGGIVSRRQDLPEEAFVNIEHAVANQDNLCAISYSWLSRTHPDPGGEHLHHFRTSGPFNDHEFGRNKLLMGWDKEGNVLVRRARDVMVFWDFLSLFQVPRSPLEDDLFRSALDSMHCIYACTIKDPGMSSITIPDAHSLSLNELEAMERDAYFAGLKSSSIVIRFVDVPASADNNTPYEERGWTMFETMVAAAGGRQVQTIMRGKAPSLLEDRRPSIVPALPDSFATMIRKLHFTSAKTDPDKVVQLYRKVFHDHLVHLKHLVASNWTDAEVDKFLAVLPYLRDFRYLKAYHLNLSKDGLMAMKLAACGSYWDFVYS